MYKVMENRPRFTEQEASHLALRWFGKNAPAVPLPSERDQNFYLREEIGAEFVLKIASASEEPQILELQNSAMAWLAERGIPCPRICPSVEGLNIVQAVSAQGTKHFVRLLTYIPGAFLADSLPHTPELLCRLGNFVGRMDFALAGFSHPAADRELVWDLKRACEVIARCATNIRDAGRRKLADSFLERFETQALPLFPNLRESIVHNDGNDHNVLVQRSRVCDIGDIAGIIDFGDMIRSFTAADPAIVSAYSVLGKPDPLSAAAQVIAGYHRAFALTESELEAMFHLICMRLTTSVALSAYQQKLEPENRYLSVSERPAWEALERLSAVHPRFAHYVFRNACGLEACPGASAVRAWLQVSEPGPITDLDLTREPVVLFDLSIESGLDTEVLLSSEKECPPGSARARKITDQLFAEMKSSGARAGIGRYNEARLWYTSDSYRVPSNEIPQTRTVHLGVDLFLPPGTPVFAPLEGTVHSLADNAQPLDYGPTIILEHQTGDGQPFFTLYGHLSRESLQAVKPGARVGRGERIAAVGHDPENGGWTPHLHFEVITDLLDRHGEFPGVAAPGQREVWLSLCPDPNLLLKVPGLRRTGLHAAEILEKRERAIGPNLSISYRQPLHIVRGHMQHLYDADGRRYLDAVNNVPHVGHCHPEVVRAARKQIGILNTNTRYLHENIVRYAERLCAKLPDPLRVCYFVCSGSEANDLALRLARTHTRKKDIIVLEGAYHGNLTSLIEISPYKFDGPGGSGPPAHVHAVPVPDIYRGVCRSGGEEAGAEYARLVGQSIERIHREGRGLAAFISETALSCAGQILLPPGYLQNVYRQVRAAGGVCIADEVQVGFGRLGSHFWGFETQGVVPDIVTMGKPIGNGHPLAAVVTTREIADSFNNGMEYFNTYGGNPVSCAVGLAVLDVIEREQLQENARIVGARMKTGLDSLMEKHRIIGDVRGSGLFLGVEMVLDRHSREPAPDHATLAVERMKQSGILVSTDGPLHNVIKIKPPMVFTVGDADFFVGAFDGILARSCAP